jgi:carboxyl-terminal processing protease
MQREADLKGALKNTDLAPQSGVGTPQTSAAPTAVPADAAAPKRNQVPTPPSTAPMEGELAAFGTADDYQLVRAVDLVRGVAMFKKVAAQ